MRTFAGHFKLWGALLAVVFALAVAWRLQQRQTYIDAVREQTQRPQTMPPADEVRASRNLAERHGVKGFDTAALPEEREP